MEPGSEITNTTTELYPIFIRITHATLTKENILDEFKTQTKYPKIIVSQEEAASTHFHIHIMGTEENKKNRRQNLVNFIKRKWGLGEGNASFAYTEAKTGTENTIACYVVKDGNYVYHGFTESQMERYKRTSFKKFDKKTYSTEMFKLQQDFLMNTHDINWYIQKYIELKYSYAMNVPFAISQTHFMTMSCRKYPHVKESMISSHKNEFARTLEFHSS